MRLQELLWRVLPLRRRHQHLKPCQAVLPQHPSLLTLLLLLKRLELGSRHQQQRLMQQCLMQAEQSHQCHLTCSTLLQKQLQQMLLPLSLLLLLKLKLLAASMQHRPQQRRQHQQQQQAKVHRQQSRAHHVLCQLQHRLQQGMWPQRPQHMQRVKHQQPPQQQQRGLLKVRLMQQQQQVLLRTLLLKSGPAAAANL
jgi:hypothetical protein